MSKWLQKLWARLQTTWCKHTWKRLSHHGLPNEPWLMRCAKCLKMARLDTYLTDKAPTAKGLE